MFLFPSFVDSAIIASFVGLRVRLIAVGVPDVPTDFGTYSLKTTSVAEGVDLGLKLTDWLGIQGTLAGRALVGTDVRSLAYFGATYDYGVGLGGVVRLLRDEGLGTRSRCAWVACTARGKSPP